MGRRLAQLKIQATRWMQLQTVWAGLQRVDGGCVAETDKIWMIVVCRNAAQRLPFMVSHTPNATRCGRVHNPFDASRNLSCKCG